LARLSKSLARDLVKKKYEAAIKPLKKAPKDMDTWVTAWEQAIEEAYERKLGIVADPEDWFDDFLQVITLVKPAWAEMYELLNWEKIITGTVTY
jgi:hypothetical protein